MIGDVAGQVGVVPALVGGLAQDPALPGIAEPGGVEPEGAVLLEDEALGGQDVDGVGDGRGLLDRGLAEPLVVDDVDGSKLPLDEPQDALGGPPPGSIDVVGPVVGRGQPLHEPGGIPPVGQRRAGPPSQQRLAKPPDLPPGVVHVVLPGDGVPAPLEDPRQAVPVRGEPPVPDMNRPGRVGGDELDHHPLAGPDVQPPIVALAPGNDVPQHVVQPGWRKGKVDEPRPGNIDGSHVRRRRGVEQIGDLASKLPRVPPGAPSGSKRNVGRPLTMLPPSRPLEHDNIGRRDAKLAKSRTQAILECDAIMGHQCCVGSGREQVPRAPRCYRPPGTAEQRVRPRGQGALPCDVPPS